LTKQLSQQRGASELQNVSWIRLYDLLSKKDDDGARPWIFHIGMCYLSNTRLEKATMVCTRLSVLNNSRLAVLQGGKNLLQYHLDLEAHLSFWECHSAGLSATYPQ